MKRHTSTMMFILLAALAVVLLLQNQPVFAGEGNGATVIKGPCGISWNGSIYEGDGQWVMTPSGKVNGHCTASLVSGPGVTENEDVEFIGDTPFGPEPYTGVLTPSGNANLFTHN